METFNYLVGLVSIVVGLALAEVATGLNRMMREGKRHDPLIMGSAALIVLMLVAIWFDIWAVRQVPNLFGFPFFLLVFANLLQLYLLAAACIPSAVDSNSTVTSERYEGNRRYFWWLFVVYQGLYAALWFFFQTRNGFFPIELADRFFGLTAPGLPLVIGTVMAIIRNRAVHALGLIILIGFVFAGYWNYRIG